MMSLLDIFHCAYCYHSKFTHPHGWFDVIDQFYCFVCENYTDNLVKTITDVNPHPPEPPLPGGVRGGHPLSER